MKVEELIVGAVYTIPSGMGGIFRVRYIGCVPSPNLNPRRIHRFHVTSPGWDDVTVTFTADDVAEQVAPR